MKLKKKPLKLRVRHMGIKVEKDKKKNHARGKRKELKQDLEELEYYKDEFDNWD